MALNRPTDRWLPAVPARQINLDLAGMVTDARHNLSAAIRFEQTLFIAGDEGCFVHRLVQLPDGGWGLHQALPLADLLTLADPDAEIDIEGLAVEDNWLWIVGSHACTRQKLAKGGDEKIDLEALAALRPMPARAFLARVPLVVETSGHLLPVRQDGGRIAGLVKQTGNGNRIAAALARHALLGRFSSLPAKEGGIDIEGIAVVGNRVALGMRGPTLGGHAVLLELQIMAKRSGRLKLIADPVVRLLSLEGLAIRDLKRDDDDLLILSGPTTAVSGPCSLWRWRGWAGDPPRDGTTVRLHKPDWLMDLPHGRGKDHPEGLALVDGDEPGIMVLPDSPAPLRFKGTRLSVDVFAWPG